MATGTDAYLLPSELPVLAFYAGALFFALFALVISYHWLRYGRRSKLTIPALALFGIVSAFLLAFAASGLI